jgi:hypothetical protein
VLSAPKGEPVASAAAPRDRQLQERSPAQRHTPRRVRIALDDEDGPADEPAGAHRHVVGEEASVEREVACAVGYEGSQVRSDVAEPHPARRLEEDLGLRCR